MSSSRERILAETESALEEARADVATLEEVLRVLREGEIKPEERLKPRPARSAPSKTSASGTLVPRELLEWIEKHIRAKPNGRSRCDYMLNGAREAIDPQITKEDVEHALTDPRFVVEERGWTRMKVP